MNPIDLLGTSAQIAVTLAGFTGVVVVYGSGAVHEWPAVDRLRLRTLVMFSVAPLALCLLSMLLFSTGLPAALVWKCSSAAAATALFAAGVLTSRMVFAVSAAELAAAGGSRVRSLLVSTVGWGVTAL